MKDLFFDLKNVLKHNRDGSFSTQAKRRNTLNRMCGVLGNEFPGLRLKNLKKKHIQYVLELWKHHKSIKTELSHIRWLLQKINKESLLPPDNKSLGISKRSIVARKNKSWLMTGVDINKKIEEVRKSDERVGLALGLCVKFGLRMKEAALFRPHENIHDSFIEVVHGTKGGLKRTVEVVIEDQRAFLETLRRKVPRGSSLIPMNWEFKNFKNRFYYVCRKNGISRKNGLTVHGLRHTYACLRYIDLTSSEPPVLRNQAQLIDGKDKDKDIMARKKIAEELGHGRVSITSAYLGSNRIKKE